MVELRDKMQHFPQAKDNDENLFYAGLLTRLLTSAVVEGDRADTADFMAGESRGEAFIDKELIWSEQKARFLPHKRALAGSKTVFF